MTEGFKETHTYCLQRWNYCLPLTRITTAAADCSRQSSGRKFYGGIGIQGRKGRPQFQFAVTNVATEINTVEQAQKADAKESQRPVFPFAAIVGQDEMKLCLLLNVIDPKIGGVMIMGDRGTGKSTTLRSLVDLLPEIRIFSFEFSCSSMDSILVMSSVGEHWSLHLSVTLIDLVCVLFCRAGCIIPGRMMLIVEYQLDCPLTVLRLTCSCSVLSGFLCSMPI
ncbi:magnesium-chelatase subunit chlI, chloroplastic-like protein [Corchorus capsularis]|uniref:Magnesium-chelatase subunit chlI, chloroplastic-like protein n=1 Tax=Corchorus capsularis TaxID=210143 RepID=A0A1R3G2P0_COCAP|nr:magnesium-chelatase subunit chlI, chloroplastic-like protein [Corchorus capsularis]